MPIHSPASHMLFPLLSHSGAFCFLMPRIFPFIPRGWSIYFLWGRCLAQMCVIMKFPLRFEVVGGNSSQCLVHRDCVSGEESQKTINWEFVKNSGKCTRLPAPHRSAFCFANLRILASQMERLPSTFSACSQKATPLDYLEIILSVTWEVLRPLYFLRNKAHPNDFKRTLQHSLRRQTSCESWKCAVPFLPRWVQCDLLWATQVCKPPKTSLAKGNGTQCQIKLRWATRGIWNNCKWSSQLRTSSVCRRRFTSLLSVVKANRQKMQEAQAQTPRYIFQYFQWCAGPRMGLLSHFSFFGCVVAGWPHPDGKQKPVCVWAGQFPSFEALPQETMASTLRKFCLLLVCSSAFLRLKWTSIVEQTQQTWKIRANKRHKLRGNKVVLHCPSSFHFVLSTP